MTDEEVRRELSEKMAVAANREIVSREIADALARKMDIVQAMTDEELLNALWDAIPQAYQMAADRAAADAA